MISRTSSQMTGLITAAFGRIGILSVRTVVTSLKSKSLFEQGMPSKLFDESKVSKLNSFNRNYMYMSTTSMDKQQFTTDHDGKQLSIDWPDGSNSRFHSVWLRHNCHCIECKQKHSGQIILDGSKVNPKIAIEDIYMCDNGISLNVKWKDSDHIGVIPLTFLKENCYSTRSQNKQNKQDTSNIKIIPKVAYKEMISGERGLLKWVRNINDYGMCLLTDVPTEDGMVAKVAGNIAPIQSSIYEKIFDVVNTPNPINVAYSNAELDFHMDLVYYESPPGLQFLHCLKYDSCVQGGESILLDVFKVAEQFRRDHPEEFEVLTRIPATFQKVHYSRENPVHMTYRRPHIMVNPEQKITNINWAPAFEGPLRINQEDVEDYYQAYYMFFRAIRSSPNIITLQLNEGDLLAFNNRMVLHGRKSFKLNGGSRHFQGCYVNIDEFKSKLNVLSRLLEDNRTVKHVGNQCWNTE